MDEGQVDDMESVHTLLPDRTQFYTWDNPNGMAQLKWGISQNEEQLAYHTLKMKVIWYQNTFFVLFCKGQKS